MRPFRLAPVLILLAAAAPATAQLPISGVGEIGGGHVPYGGTLRWFHFTDTPPSRPWRDSRVGARDVELVGQIGRLERRIRQMRDNGEISRAEARRMRRETRHMVAVYFSSSRDGLSDFEAGALQSRINAFVGVTAAPRVPTGR